MNFLADTPRFEIGRLASIPVRVDITFLLVPIFLFDILQQAPFEIAGPAYATIIAGVFLSVLLHELGHASVARLLGVPVGEILVGAFTATRGCSKRRARPPPMLRFCSPVPSPTACCS